MSAYRLDLRCFWQWCADRDLAPLHAKRPHVELYLRHLEERGYAPATISRRVSTLAGLFRYAVLDELVTEVVPGPVELEVAVPRSTPTVR